METTTLVKIKQVAEKGTLNKGTWDHCVFNAMGDEYGIKVSGMVSATAISALASDFIRHWDSDRDYTTTNLLSDVNSILETRTDVPQEFEEVNMGRVKAVRRRSISRSTMLTTEELDANFMDELESLLA